MPGVLLAKVWPTRATKGVPHSAHGRCPAPLSSYCQVPFHWQLLSVPHLADEDPEAEGSGFTWLCHTPLYKEQGLRCSVPGEVLVPEVLVAQAQSAFPLTGHLRTCKQSSLLSLRVGQRQVFQVLLPHTRQVVTSGLSSAGEVLPFLWARQGWREWELGPSCAGGRGP